MKPAERMEYGFFAVLAAGVLVLTAAAPSPSWYLFPLLIALIGGVMYYTRTWQDRAFILLCAGQPLVIACGAISLYAGLFVVWMVAGIVLSGMGMFGSEPDRRSFLYFCGATLVIAAGIGQANHVLLPLLILGAATVVFVAVQTIREYRFRKQYTGASL
jgi:Ni,Fe-hydrogenase I cytochrome b subunit